MKQSYHSNAVTNLQIRTLLNKSKLSSKELSNIYDISEKTVSKWKKRELCKKVSKLDQVCIENNTEHRLTKPFTPKTNGMLEKANDIIKNATIKKTKYNSVDEMREDLIQFLIHYNLYRRHGSLRRVKVKTPFDAIEKWHEIDPTIFKENPAAFKEKILHLKYKFKQNHKEQPCET